MLLSRIRVKRFSICAIAGTALLGGVLCTAVRAQAPKAAFELQGISPSFWSLVDRNAQLATVASGFGFTEGPVWDKAGYLWVSDEVINKIFCITLADGQKHEVIALGDPDGNTYDKEQRLLDCASVLRAVTGYRLMVRATTFSPITIKGCASIVRTTSCSVRTA